MFHAQHKGLLQDWEYQYMPPMFMADPDNRAQAELLHKSPFDSCDDFLVGDQWYFWAEGDRQYYRAVGLDSIEK